jgi:hypothetical protein
MDPDETLAAIRSIIAGISTARWVDDAITLAMHVEALDDWLSKGGSLPTDWAALRS